jgi:hypothetical protein
MRKQALALRLVLTQHLHPLQRGEGGEDILQDQAGQPLDHGNIGSHSGAKILATVPPRVPEGRNRPRRV